MHNRLQQVLYFSGDALAMFHACISNLNLADLASTEGRTKAKEKLLTAVEKAYEDKVMDIYFTEFVMQ